jgi:mono/diheme cytochrome c family protein
MKLVTRSRMWTVGCTALFALLPASAMLAQDNLANRRTFSSGYRFVEMTGEELFANVCQGCHMPDAAGAAGAGAYPSLSANKNLEVGGYPITLIVKGRRGMPPFGDMMTDGQVAAVVNYVRTHFGNSYQDAVTAKDVSDVRR